MLRLFFVLDATASPACLFAATALPVAFGGFALHGPCPVGSSGSCFQYVPMGAATLSAAMLAAIVFLYTGFGSMTTGLDKDFEGLESAAFDAIASLAVNLDLVFDNAATAGPAALVPCFFCYCLRCAFSSLCSSKANQPFRKMEVVPLG